MPGIFIGVVEGLPVVYLSVRKAETVPPVGIRVSAVGTHSGS